MHDVISYVTFLDFNLCVHLKFLEYYREFLKSVNFQVPCEVPESYEAYRKQQHRWHSGPMQLFRLCLPAIVKSKVYLILMLK